MPLTLTPDCERVVSDWLRSHPDVQAVNGQRVRGTAPAREQDRDTSWVQVTQLAAPDVSEGLEHLVRFMVQFDCYAGKTGGQPEASLLARTVRAALHAMQGQVAPDGTVCTAVEVTGHARVLDDSVFKPARERVALTANVWLHP